MSEIQDWIVSALPVNTRQGQAARLRQFFEDHFSRLPHGGKLGRITEQDQGWKNLFQIVKLTLIQHRGFVNKADIQRFFAPFPSRNKIRTTQPGSSQSRRNAADPINP